MVKVGKYTSSMDPMGSFLRITFIFGQQLRTFYALERLLYLSKRSFIFQHYLRFQNEKRYENQKENENIFQPPAWYKLDFFQYLETVNLLCLGGIGGGNEYHESSPPKKKEGNLFCLPAIGILISEI